MRTNSESAGGVVCALRDASSLRAWMTVYGLVGGFNTEARRRKGTECLQGSCLRQDFGVQALKGGVEMNTRLMLAWGCRWKVF